MEPIDWVAAQRVGELLAGSPSPAPKLDRSLGELSHDYAARVSEYSELSLPGEMPRLEAVDRPTWIAANLATMRPILEPLGERMGSGLGPIAGSVNAVTRMLLGAQVGALTGVLSQRVLGQYDLALLDASVSPRLLLITPNLHQAARTLGVDRDQLIRWVTIHEVTHAVQFGAVGWLRGHLAGLLTSLIEGMNVTVTASQLFKRPGGNDLRDLIQRVRRGELMRLTLGDERWDLVEQMQATMSLIEGHAEHVMDAIGAEVLPDIRRLREAMTRRRENRGTPWKVLERLLGLELKMRQYEVGRRFCNAVVTAGGPQALARVWAAAEMLPTTAELQQPSLWITRTDVPSVTK